MMRAATVLLLGSVLCTGCSDSDSGDSPSDVAADEDATSDDEDATTDDEDATSDDEDATSDDEDAASDDDDAASDDDATGDAGNDDDPEPDDAEPDSLPSGPGAFDPDFATSSDFFTATDGPRDGLASSPHNVVQIFYSTNIESVIDQPTFEAPPGTVAIKTQDSNDDGSIDNIMVMIKLAEGEDPDTEDWLYQRRRANGDLDVEGAPTLNFCPDCHTAWPDTDGLAGTTLMD